MSSLRSAIEELRGEDIGRLDDEQLESDVLELQRASDVLLAERARRIAEVDRRGSYRRDGFLSSTAWLANRSRMSFAAAKVEVRTALALDRMPAARAALSEGEVSGSAVRVLVAAYETNPEEYPDSESALVDGARTVSVAELTARVGEWRRDADSGSGELERRQHERRSLDIAPTPDGMVRLRAEFPPEQGQTIITSLHAWMDADVRGAEDMRSPTQRRADAAEEIFRRYLDSADRPLVAGERPHVTVMVNAGALQGHGGRCEMSDVGAISTDVARRIACDASVTRVITKGRSAPLDVGRKTQVIPSAIRRAVVVRDRACRFPGCDRPDSWCDAHHVVHWADGGETSLSNVLLLCRPHHRLIHQGFGVEMTERGPTFRRPDGTTIEDRAPP
jgi:hypothetical protein